MNIWDMCRGEAQVQPIGGTLHRLVESQEHIATLTYVDSLEEQALLEEMLESVKPPCPTESGNYHYLLKTPFRYPPLPWGSRFGRTHEPSIFYGGKSDDVILAESAYYRFIFWYSMDAPPIKNKIRTEHTLFTANYYSLHGIQLQRQAFNEYCSELSHPQNYQACQLLGSEMRAARVEAFEYLSARDPEGGTCVGLFTPDAFIQKKPLERSQWLCEMNATEVSFKAVESSTIKSYDITNFYHNNELPFPA